MYWQTPLVLLPNHSIVGIGNTTQRVLKRNPVMCCFSLGTGGAQMCFSSDGRHILYRDGGCLSLLIEVLVEFL